LRHYLCNRSAEVEGCTRNLVAVPALAAKAAPAARGEADERGLWPEARAAIDFHRRHLPAGHRLDRPALDVERRDSVARRTARLAVLDGETPVGFLRLDATFRADDPAACLWQGTVVAGDWYGATVANAFKAGRFAPTA
jgi:hypothetical protein